MVRTYRKRRLRGTRRRYGGRRRLQSSTVGSYGGSYAGLGPPRPYSTGPTIRYSSGRTRSTMMARRARNAALTRVRRKNTRGSIPKGFQMTRQKYQIGKNLSNAALLAKLDNKTLDQRILFKWGINRCTDTTGYYELGVHNTTATNVAFPLILHEVTGNYNIATTAPPSRTAWLNMRMCNTSAGDVSWFPLNCGEPQDASIKPTSATGDGVLLPKTRDETMNFQNNGLSVTNVGPANQMIEWINAKFCFRLPTQRAGWIKVSLIQFIDTEKQPSAQYNIMTAGSDPAMYWQRVVKPSLYSPIQGNGIAVNVNNRGIKYLKSWTKTFQPAETTEGDGNGNHYQLKIFARLNRYLRYGVAEAQPLDGGVTTASELNAGELLNIANPTTNKLINFPIDWRSRVYLMVQGSHFDTGTPLGSAVSPTNTITYDYHLRSKFLCRGDN